MAAPITTSVGTIHRTAPPRKRWPWVIVTIVLMVASLIVGIVVGHKNGVKDEKARVVAEANAIAAKEPPANLYCPARDSDEARTTAITGKAIYVIDQPPAGKVVVMDKGVVVFVRAGVTGDLVVCGNDARLVLEQPLAPSARLLMQGGTDTGTKGAGPMVYLADDVAQPGADQAWFSNKNPQFVRCGKINAALRPCTSFVTSPEVAASLSPSPKPSPTKKG